MVARAGHRRAQSYSESEPETRTRGPDFDRHDPGLLGRPGDHDHQVTGKIPPTPGGGRGVIVPERRAPAEARARDC
jgi:hypothetical protein